MKRTSRKYLADGEWYPITDYDTCCGCGLMHKVKYRINKGVIERASWRVKKITLPHAE